MIPLRSQPEITATTVEAIQAWLQSDGHDRPRLDSARRVVFGGCEFSEHVAAIVRRRQRDQAEAKDRGVSLSVLMSLKERYRYRYQCGHCGRGVWRSERAVGNERVKCPGCLRVMRLAPRVKRFRIA